jgi:5-methylthioadenosine/S-adenosylhomocysteine deaminase
VNTTVLAGATILTVDPSRNIFDDGFLAFDDSGAIVAIGSRRDMPAFDGAGFEIIDARHSVIVPGFVDAHAHLGESVMRGLVPDDAAPQVWLSQWLLPAYAVLEPEDERAACDLAFAELLLTGTTTVCEAGTLLSWEAAADAADACGIRAQLGRWTWDLPARPERMRFADSGAALDAATALIDGVRARANPRLSAALILLGIGTASEALLRDAPIVAAERGVPLAMMYASVAPEHGGVALSIDELGTLGWLVPRTKLVHTVYIDPADVAKLAAGGVSVVHCPSAALRHVKGIHRYGLFPEMLAAGTPVALGGDSANGSNHLNMLRLMYLAATLYKDFRMDTSMIPPETALEMATIHGARALGLEDRIGSLEVGKRADFAVFSTNHPEWRPLLHPVQNLVLGATDRSLASVWVDGRKLVEAGRLLTLNVETVCARADASAAAVLERTGLRVPSVWPHRS